MSIYPVRLRVHGVDVIDARARRIRVSLE